MAQRYTPLATRPALVPFASAGWGRPNRGAQEVQLVKQPDPPTSFQIQPELSSGSAAKNTQSQIVDAGELNAVLERIEKLELESKQLKSEVEILKKQIQVNAAGTSKSNEALDNQPILVWSYV